MEVLSIMQWNWQQTDWPDFTYDEAAFALLEKRFLQESGILFGAFTHIDERDKKQLTIELISTEAVTSGLPLITAKYLLLKKELRS
jgi:Fic family protein